MKIAVFPGSFDPFTIAHQDLIERALPLFDKIVIAIGINSSKQALLDFDARKDAITALFEGNEQIDVTTYQGLTVNLCKELGARFILRGLRNGTDLDFERAIAQNNLILNPEIESYFLISRGETAHISSTIVRDILKHGGDVSSLVPEKVLKYVK